MILRQLSLDFQDKLIPNVAGSDDGECSGTAHRGEQRHVGDGGIVSTSRRHRRWLIRVQIIAPYGRLCENDPTLPRAWLGLKKTGNEVHFKRLSLAEVPRKGDTEHSPVGITTQPVIVHLNLCWANLHYNSGLTACSIPPARAKKKALFMALLGVRVNQQMLYSNTDNGWSLPDGHFNR
ncbi:hypothetical protein B0H16DRAFT_1461660 [Mycena metata]|uniref:Uncharacterized protein n=1 Tax=Mycena metata TaxID=1033252 RepID=A0AAD7IQI3_9AGAR|nr:hypothetical protein B0H16DRAFT_1461660 [Mycena metata]